MNKIQTKAYFTKFHDVDLQTAKTFINSLYNRLPNFNENKKIKIINSHLNGIQFDNLKELKTFLRGGAKQ